MKQTTLFSATFLLLVSASGCAQMLQSAGVDANAVQGGAPSSATPGEAPGMPEPAADAEPAGEPAPTGPSTVSVTIKSDCKDTVKVFYGEKPKFGSGTYSSVSSNSRSSHTFKPGEMFWIVDDSQNGVASATVEAGTKEITVEGSCSSLAAR